VLGAAAHGEHIVAADEDIQLADAQLIAHHFDGVEDHEQRMAVLLELWPLVAVARVLDGERCRSNSSCISASSASAASLSATHTKQPGRAR